MSTKTTGIPWLAIAFVAVALTYVFLGNKTAWTSVDPPEFRQEVSVEQYVASGSGYPELRPISLEVVLGQSDKVVVIDFWAEWCGWCRKLEPELEQVAMNMKDDVIIVRLNVDEYPDMAAHFEVGGIPDLRFFHNRKAFGGCGYCNASAIQGHIESIDKSPSQQ